MRTSGSAQARQERRAAEERHVAWLVRDSLVVQGLRWIAAWLRAPWSRWLRRSRTRRILLTAQRRLWRQVPLRLLAAWSIGWLVAYSLVLHVLHRRPVPVEWLMVVLAVASAIVGFGVSVSAQSLTRSSRVVAWQRWLCSGAKKPPGGHRDAA